MVDPRPSLLASHRLSRAQALDMRATRLSGLTGREVANPGPNTRGGIMNADSGKERERLAIPPPSGFVFMVRLVGDMAGGHAINRRTD